MTLTNLYGISPEGSLWLGNVPSGYRPYANYTYAISVGTNNTFTYIVNASNGAINGSFAATFSQNANFVVYGIWITS